MSALTAFCAENESKLEDQFVAVMLNCGLAGERAPSQAVMHRTLDLAKQAGFMQAQAQVSCYSNLSRQVGDDDLGFVTLSVLSSC